MKKWILLVIVVLIAVLDLVPAVFAQGPLNQDSSSYGSGPMMRTDFGPGNGQRTGNAANPAFGMGPRWGGSSGSLITVAVIIVVAPLVTVALVQLSPLRTRE